MEQTKKRESAEAVNVKPEKSEGDPEQQRQKDAKPLEPPRNGNPSMLRGRRICSSRFKKRRYYSS